MALKTEQKLPLVPTKVVGGRHFFTETEDVHRLPNLIEVQLNSYQWFLGENILRVPLYDPETKGCCDGLQETAINRNQGAESTLAYLISHLTVLKALELEYQYDHLGEALVPVA